MNNFLQTLAVATFVFSCGPNESHSSLVNQVDNKSEFTLPQSFVVHEKIISFPTLQFTLLDGKEKIGTISEKFLTLMTTFTFKDRDGKVQATANLRFFAIGSTVDVFDANKQKIGVIKEKIFKSLIKIETEYSILDGNEKEIAVSDKLQLLGLAKRG